MTAGWWIGTLVAGVFAVIALVVLIIGLILVITDGDRDAWGIFGVGFVALLIIAGIWTAATFPPFQTKYHQYRPVTGTVSAVGTRLLGDDKSTTQAFVLSLDGKGDYRCDDTRCSLIHVGDVVSLQCIGVFELHGTSGYRCNYVGDKPALITK